MEQALTDYTFANNSICPRCLKKTSDLVRYEGCDHCGMKTPQGTGLMSMKIPFAMLNLIWERNPGIKLQ